MKVSNVPSEYEVAKAIGPMIEKQIWANMNAIAERAENGKIATEQDLKSEADRVFIDGQDALVEHSNHYAQAVHARVLVARSISRLSPAALFQYGAESIARTGFIAEESFQQDITNYSRQYDAYILNKVGTLVRTSKWNFSIIIYFKGKPIPIQSPQPVEYSGGMEDFPPFTETEKSLLDCIHSALLDLAGLLFWNLAAAVAGLLVFLRADVR